MLDPFSETQPQMASATPTLAAAITSPARTFRCIGSMVAAAG